MGKLSFEEFMTFGTRQDLYTRLLEKYGKQTLTLLDCKLVCKCYSHLGMGGLLEDASWRKFQELTIILEPFSTLKKLVFFTER